MLNLVPRQHPPHQWFDQELEGTSLIERHGTHCVLQLMFLAAEVGMPLVHIVEEWETCQCIGVLASLLPRNGLHPSLVILLGTRDL
jgi:hypothetical protein